MNAAVLQAVGRNDVDGTFMAITKHVMREQPTEGPAQVTDALEHLVRTGLLRQDASKFYYELTDAGRRAVGAHVGSGSKVVDGKPQERTQRLLNFMEILLNDRAVHHATHMDRATAAALGTWPLDVTAAVEDAPFVHAFIQHWWPRAVMYLKLSPRSFLMVQLRSMVTRDAMDVTLRAMVLGIGQHWSAYEVVLRMDGLWSPGVDTDPPLLSRTAMVRAAHTVAHMYNQAREGQAGQEKSETQVTEKDPHNLWRILVRLNRLFQVSFPDEPALVVVSPEAPSGSSQGQVQAQPKTQASGGGLMLTEPTRGGKDRVWVLGAKQEYVPTIVWQRMDARKLIDVMDHTVRRQLPMDHLTGAERKTVREWAKYAHKGKLGLTERIIRAADAMLPHALQNQVDDAPDPTMARRVLDQLVQVASQDGKDEAALALLQASPVLRQHDPEPMDEDHVKKLDSAIFDLRTACPSAAAYLKARMDEEPRRFNCMAVRRLLRKLENGPMT